MNMDKAIILALLLGFSSASGAAFAGQCPAKGSITSTGVENGHGWDFKHGLLLPIRH